MTTPTTPRTRATAITHRALLLAGLAAMTVAAGCGDRPAPAASSSSVGDVGTELVAQNTATRKAVPPAPLKANGSGVQVGADVAIAEPGQPLAVTLQFSGVTGTGTTASLAAETGLRIESGDTAFSLPAGSSSHALQVTAAQAGLFYIHVTTVQDGRGSVTSVPVQVGSSAAASQKLQSPGELKTGAGGVGKVIVMPAP